jgi:hypothetical protein
MGGAVEAEGVSEVVGIVSKIVALRFRPAPGFAPPREPLGVPSGRRRFLGGFVLLIAGNISLGSGGIL